MAERIRKFVPRAFRYVLRPQDQGIMRFSLAHEEKHGESPHQTLLLNLSESGVAFLVARGTKVYLGESIKVEVPVPSGDQIAWWGRVVRVQEYEPPGWFFAKDRFAEEPKMLVGVTFDHLPEGHSRAIRKGIEVSFMKAMRDQQYRNWIYYRTLFFQNLGRAILYTFLTLATLFFIWYFTQPSANYDAGRGAPWGDRFK